MTDKRKFVLYTLRYLLAHEMPTNINTRTYEGIESMYGSFYLKGFKYWFEFWKNKLTLSVQLQLMRMMLQTLSRNGLLMI